MRIIINHNKPNQEASDAKVKLSDWSPGVGGGVYEEEGFSSSPTVGKRKKGAQDMLASHETLKRGGWWWRWRRQWWWRWRWGEFSFFFFPPPFPLTPRCLAALSSAPSVSREVVAKCVCVCEVVVVLGGGGALIESEQSGTSRIVSPPALPPPRRLTPWLPPSFSRDKECPECLASPAVSNN